MTVVEVQSNGKRRVTIREVATLLGVHPNTVRTRIRDGSLEAEKVVTERGPTWMLDPDSLTTNTPPSDSQQLVGRMPEEALTLSRETVREAGLDRRTADDLTRRQDRAFDAIRDHWKVPFESAKHESTVAGALLWRWARSPVCSSLTLAHRWSLTRRPFSWWTRLAAPS